MLAGSWFPEHLAETGSCWPTASMELARREPAWHSVWWLDGAALRLRVRLSWIREGDMESRRARSIIIRPWHAERPRTCRTDMTQARHMMYYGTCSRSSGRLRLAHLDHLGWWCGLCPRLLACR